MKQPKEYVRRDEAGVHVGVYLPDSILRIIDAAGGGVDMPRAMASIVGALPWICVAVSQKLTREEYVAFIQEMRGQLDGCWRIIAADDPKAAFDRAFAEAKKALQ
jgi:hypothetical protein